MGLCRLATAIVALAFIAGVAAAQVTEFTPPDKSVAATDKVVAPAEPQTEPAPIQISSVPEPGSILLLTGLSGGVGWVYYWRRRWRAGPTEPKTQP
jgi:hypothetical protein